MVFERTGLFKLGLLTVASASVASCGGAGGGGGEAGVNFNEDVPSEVQDTGSEDSGSNDGGESQNELHVDAFSAFANLRNRVAGTTYVIPYIRRDLVLDSTGNPIRIPFSSALLPTSSIDEFLSPVNVALDLEVTFEDVGGVEYILATSVNDSLSGALQINYLDLSAIVWNYLDQDGDTIPDVQELGILPIDCDADNRDAYEDPDSDSDGLLDGLDATPNGPPCV